MTQLNRALAALAFGLAMGTAATAATYTANLSGLEEVPPNASPGFGTVSAELTGFTLVLTGSFDGLQGAWTANHIHNAPAGSNGGVVRPLVRTPAGSFGGSWEAANNTFILSAAEVAALQAGNYYVNVHSQFLPGGEIRGQLHEVVTAGVDDQPVAFALQQNFPNPFNPSTTISMTMGETAKASLIVYNILGQPVATLLDGVVARGEHQVTFDAATLPSGIYVYTLRSEGVHETRSMLLVR